MSVAALLPAAGTSRRLGRDKRLLDLGGETLLQRAARRALAAALEPVVVVLEAGAGPALRAPLDALGVRVAVSPDPGLGMNASLRSGLELVAASPACLLLLPDMPRVDESMLVALRELCERERPALVVSRYGAVEAPPVVFASELFAELMAPGAGDRRGREVVRRHRERALVQDWPPERLVDLDTPVDLDTLLPGTG